MLSPNFITDQQDISDSYGRFVISPLPAGFGHTLGNALRRTLLSSIEGAAASYVKINNVTHIFSTLRGIKDSVLDIVLNIKSLRFRTIGNGPFEINLSVKGRKKILASDLKGVNIEVVNKDQYLTEITDDKTKLEMTIIVEKGAGYLPSEEKEKKGFGFLTLDTAFSPVTRVNYKVEPTRVGRKSNFDKLILEIWTDKTISPVDALRESANLLSQYFSFLLSGEDVKKEQEQTATQEGNNKPKIDKKVYQTIIDELDLPTRVINALLREKIETVADLVKAGRENVVNMKGVGKKSVDLIAKELQKLGLEFN